MKDQDAVSPVIGTLLVLVMFAVTTATIVAIVRPEIVEYQEQGKVGTIAAQMGNVVSDVRHLAINGNPAEIRQPVMSFHEGQFQLDSGHVVATTIGQFGNVSRTTEDTYRDAGFYHSFSLAPEPASGASLFSGVIDGSDDAVQMRFHHPYYTGGRAFQTNYEVHRWNSYEWVLQTSGTTAMTDGSTAPLMLDPSGTWTISDGPFRVAFYNRSVLPPQLEAQIFIYEQTSLSYSLSGESGLLSVYGENGGIISSQDGRFRLEQSALVKPPSTALGNELFSLRSVRLNATGAAAVSGSAQVGLIMRLNVTEGFVFDHGASHVRMQFWGNHPSAWENQLISNGFTDDSANDRGVYWAYEKTAGRHWSFPIHFIDSQIDVRMTSR